MKVSKKKLAAGFAWIPLGLMALGHQIFAYPLLIGLPFGGVIAEAVFWCLFLPFAASISYAITIALFWTLMGTVCVLWVCLDFITGWTGTGWLEGDVRIPTTPQTAFNLIAGFVAGFVALSATTVQMVGGWVTAEPSEPSELERVQDAYARGELSDLEMEQQIEEAMDEAHEPK